MGAQSAGSSLKNTRLFHNEGVGNMELYRITYHFGRGTPIITETRGDSKGKSREERLERVVTIATQRAEKLHANSFTVKPEQRL